MVLIEDITDQHQQPSVASAAAAAPASTTAASEDTTNPPPPPPPPASSDMGDELASDVPEDVLPSDERIMDAHEIEKLVTQVERPTAKLHLTSLVTKLRREAEALQRMEKARKLQQSPSKSTSERKKPADENQDPVATAGAAAASPSKGAPSAGASAAPSVLSPPPVPVPAPSTTAVPSLNAYYVPIDRFAFDAGGYNAPFVTLYVDLPGVGNLPRESITCNFTKTSVDLIVRNLGNKSYRLYKDNLDKDIDPTKSKIVVKSNKVLVKLAKIKSEYGSYDYWSQLTSKKTKKKDDKAMKDDPSASIMQLMKDMYDDGDDNMRKVIGETMLKQQRGELGSGKDGGLGGFGGAAMGGGLKDDDDDF